MKIAAESAKANAEQKAAAAKREKLAAQNAEAQRLKEHHQLHKAVTAAAKEASAKVASAVKAASAEKTAAP